MKPYPDNVPLEGPLQPAATTIDDLIRLLLTVQKRFGNTCVRYYIQWGASGLHAIDAQEREIERLGRCNDEISRSNAEVLNHQNMEIDRLNQRIKMLIDETHAAADVINDQAMQIDRLIFRRVIG